MANGLRDCAGRSGGAAAHTENVAKACATQPHSPVEARRSAPLDSQPPVELERSRMSGCLICGSPRFAPLFTASDRLYHTTSQPFAVVRCGECGLIRLNPPPVADELPRYYPDNYWFAPDQSAASRLEE